MGDPPLYCLGTGTYGGVGGRGMPSRDLTGWGGFISYLKETKRWAKMVS